MASRNKRNKQVDHLSSWRVGLNTMPERWAAVFAKEIPDILHDVTFLIGSGKKPLGCHKLVLTVASPVFQAMFSSAFDTGNKNAIIEVPDLDFNGFKNLTTYLYTGNIDIKVQDALTTMYAANKYDIPEIVSHCSNLLQSKLSVENVITIYQSAVALKDASLEHKARTFLVKNFDKVLSVDDFLELSKENIIKLVSLDEIAVTSEVQLFLAIVRWARNQCEKQETKVNNRNIANVLEDIVQYIRFPVMSAKKFTTHVEPTEILSEKECYKLFKYFSLSENDRNSVSMQYSKTPRTNQRQVLREIVFWTNMDHAEYYLHSKPQMQLTSANETFQLTNFRGTKSIFLKGISLIRAGSNSQYYNHIGNSIQVFVTITDNCKPTHSHFHNAANRAAAMQTAGLSGCVDSQSVKTESQGTLESQGDKLWNVAVGPVELHPNHIYKIAFRNPTTPLNVGYASSGYSGYITMEESLTITEGSKSVMVRHIGGYQIVAAMKITL